MKGSLHSREAYDADVRRTSGEYLSRPHLAALAVRLQHAVPLVNAAAASDALRLALLRRYARAELDAWRERLRREYPTEWLRPGADFE